MCGFDQNLERISFQKRLFGRSVASFFGFDQTGGARLVKTEHFCQRRAEKRGSRCEIDPAFGQNRKKLPAPFYWPARRASAARRTPVDSAGARPLRRSSACKAARGCYGGACMSAACCNCASARTMRTAAGACCGSARGADDAASTGERVRAAGVGAGTMRTLVVCGGGVLVAPPRLCPLPLVARSWPAHAPSRSACKPHMFAAPSFAPGAAYICIRFFVVNTFAFSLQRYS